MLGSQSDDERGSTTVRKGHSAQTPVPTAKMRHINSESHSHIVSMGHLRGAA